ncbi:MAG: BT_3928 family protein [Bacteroidales bacterium]
MKFIAQITNTIRKIDLPLTQIILGVVFIFSGFSKIIDPYGSFYKMVDYFREFGLSDLNQILPIFSVFLPAIELTLGLNALLGINRKSTSRLLFIFMLGMTPFTLYILIYNPVSDCGCFGDLIKISNLSTFVKNVILLVLSFHFLRHRKRAYTVYSYGLQWFVESYVFLFSMIIGWFAWNYLPIIETLPFKVGTDIVKAMEIPEGAKQDVYETTLIYKKDDIEKEFTLDNYPANDTTWVFVDSKSKLVEKGFQPQIAPFSIYDNDGTELTDSILHSSQYTFLLTVPRFSWANEKYIYRVNDLYDFCLANKYGFFCITSSSQEEIDEWKEGTGADYPILTADETTIKSMVRSVPGLLLLKEGVIINKWSSVTIPDETTLESDLASLPAIVNPPDRTTRRMMAFILLLTVPLLIMLLAEKTVLLILRRIRLFKQLETREEDLNGIDTESPESPIG